MDRFQINLAGRWRTDPTGSDPALATPTPGLPEDLRDHIDLRLGEQSLTAHLGDDAVLPFLLALTERLVALPDGGTTQIPLAPSGHHLRLSRRRTRYLVSFLTETGRAVVHNVPVDVPALRAAVQRAGEAFLSELLEARPAWRRLAIVRRFRSALEVLTTLAEGGIPAADTAAPVRVPSGRTGGRTRVRPSAPPDFPLAVTESGLRLGAQPASGNVGAGRRGTLQRLFDAIEALAREPDRRVGLPWSTSPRTTLQLERTAAGLVTWALRDTLAPWMSGQVKFPALLARLRTAAAAMPEFDPVEARLRLRAIRRWLRAESMPPLLGGPLVQPPLAAAESTAPVGEAAGFEARRLVHVAFRRLWRRALKRFFLPAQHLDGETFMVHTIEGALGLGQETGRERWRLPGAHPLLAGGPPDVLFDARGRLMRIDSATGEPRWCEPRPWRRPPAVAAHLDTQGLVVMTEAGELLALDAAGRRLFATRLLAGTALGLTAGPTLLFVAGEDAHLSAFCRGDGALHFRVPVHGHAVGAPHLTRDALVVLVERGARSHILTFDPTTGRLRGDHPLPGHVQSVQLVGRATPTLAAVQTMTDDGTLTSVFDTASGRLRFALPVSPGRASLSIYQGVLYLGGEGGRVSAFDADDGAVLWTQAGDDTGDEPALHVRPLGVRGLIYALGSALRVLEPANGRVVSRHALDGFEVGAWLVSPTGDVLMADPERALLYLRLSGHLSRVD